MDTVNDQFRIVGIPGLPLAIPSKLAGMGGAWTVTDRGDIYTSHDVEFGDESSTAREYEWGEIYLRLSTLDTSKSAVIEDWVSELGPMGWCWTERRGGGERTALADASGLRANVGPFAAPALDAVNSNQPSERRYAEAGDARVLLERNESLEGPLLFETYEEFRLAADTLTDLTACLHLLQVTEGDERSSETATLRLLRTEMGQQTVDVAAAAYVICEHLSRLVAWHTPRLMVLESGVTVERERARFVSPYQCMAAEIYNHIVEGLPYRVCAAPDCARIFVRQQGRAVHGQHRTRSVLYCSAECGRRVARRRYREKARLAKAERDATP